MYALASIFLLKRAIVTQKALLSVVQFSYMKKVPKSWVLRRRNSSLKSFPLNKGWFWTQRELLRNRNTSTQSILVDTGSLNNKPAVTNWILLGKIHKVVYKISHIQFLETRIWSAKLLHPRLLIITINRVIFDYFNFIWRSAVEIKLQSSFNVEKSTQTRKLNIFCEAKTLCKSLVDPNKNA